MSVWLLFALVTAADPPQVRVIARSEWGDDTAVARVEGRTIDRREVEMQLQQSLGHRPVDQAARPNLTAQMLDQLVRQRLIVRALERSGRAPTNEVLDKRIKELERRLAGEGSELEEFYAERGWSHLHLREHLIWRIGWRTFLEQRQNDDFLRAHFEAHRRQFDGSRAMLSHILWKVGGAAGRPQDEALQLAHETRRAIESGELSFAEAARRDSDGATGPAGGDLGEVPRRGQMGEEFSRAAFRLAPGEISPPVVTTFGVHLIQCRGYESGNRTWQEVRTELREAVSRTLFREISNRAAQGAVIEYVDDFPHLPFSAAPVNSPQIDQPRTR